MDDETALIARRVAMAAAAWFNAPADVEAYRRLAAEVEEWNAYCAPADGPEAGEGAARRAGRHRPAEPLPAPC